MLVVMNSKPINELLLPFLSSSGTSSQMAGSDASISLSGFQLNLISMYIDILLRWSARINLTAIRNAEEIVTRHFGESLFAARHLFPPAQQPKSGLRLIDIGSGAGFPGVPIKVWAPDLSVTLIEPNHKKATFLKEVIRALALTDTNVVMARAEAFQGEAEVVTLRAVEHFETTLPVATKLVGPGGQLAHLLGERQALLVRRLAPKFRWRDPIPMPLSMNRVLLIGQRESA
jgi:16S rRNA (guanine527-N7)-methyltransferase